MGKVYLKKVKSCHCSFHFNKIADCYFWDKDDDCSSKYCKNEDIIYIQVPPPEDKNVKKKN